MSRLGSKAIDKLIVKRNKGESIDFPMRIRIDDSPKNRISSKLYINLRDFNQSDNQQEDNKQQSHYIKINLPVISNTTRVIPINKEEIIIKDKINKQMPKINNSHAAKELFKLKYPYGKKGNCRSINFNEESFPSPFQNKYIDKSKSEYYYEYHPYDKSYRKESTEEFTYNKNYKNFIF